MSALGQKWSFDPDQTSVCFAPKADIQLLEGDYRCSRSTSSKKPLAWLERGGPRIDRPIDREGFGSTLARMTVTGS